MTSQPKRRRLQFGLRHLLTAMAACALLSSFWPAVAAQLENADRPTCRPAFRQLDLALRNYSASDIPAANRLIP